MNKINANRIANHFLFWFIWITSFTLIQSFGFGIPDYTAWLFYYLITLPLFVAHTYVITYWMVPQYFFKSRYLIFSNLIIALLVFSSVFELLISNEFIWNIVKPENIQKGNYLNWQNILINGIGNEYIVIVFLSVKVIRFWNSKNVEKTELMNRKLLIEIELLKYQSFPVFLLNLLNKLELLALNKSSLTSEMIIRLSNLMRNLIFSPNVEKIVLNKEIDIIKSYISIRQIGTPNLINQGIQVSGGGDDFRIPPLLLFRVVEEGFAAMENSDGQNEYSILIKNEPHYLFFSMTTWSEKLLNKQFNPEIIENCQKSLNFYYGENNKIVMNREVNSVEVIIEIYH